MRRARTWRAAFANAAQDEAYLTIYFGIPACEDYIRQQIAWELAADPELCEPEQGLTKPLHRVAWHNAATAIVTSGWWQLHGASTEVDQVLASRHDPNATQPVKAR